jgi:hypothetical protein
MSVASSWSVSNGIRIVMPGPIATLAIGAMTPHVHSNGARPAFGRGACARIPLVTGASTRNRRRPHGPRKRTRGESESDAVPAVISVRKLGPTMYGRQARFATRSGCKRTGRSQS